MRVRRRVLRTWELLLLVLLLLLLFVPGIDLDPRASYLLGKYLPFEPHVPVLFFICLFC